MVRRQQRSDSEDPILVCLVSFTGTSVRSLFDSDNTYICCREVWDTAQRGILNDHHRRSSLDPKRTGILADRPLLIEESVPAP
jgi:hypothetical protein